MDNEFTKDVLRRLLVDSHEDEMSRLRIKLSVMGIDPDGPQGVEEIFKAQLKYESDLANLAPKQYNELPWADKPKVPEPPKKNFWEP
jgi:hypothetical protein